MQNIQTKQVHIWSANLKQHEAGLAYFLGLLNAQEKARANKFVVEKAKNNFIVARGILRKLLGAYLQVSPEEVVFCQNQYGKLFLANSPLQFNISHSHDLALFVFALGCQVGIDVELIRDDFEYVDIARRFFSREESTELFLLPEHEQRDAFFNCWSRKEAYIKAIGKGVFCDLDGFTVEVSSKKEGKIRLNPSRDFMWCDLSLEAINPAPGYVGAFAVAMKEYEVIFQQVI